MASPLTTALVTQWIEDGAADAPLRFIRSETRDRQSIAKEALRQPFVRSAFIGHLRARNIGLVARDGFTTGPSPVEAMRVCLGGPTNRNELRASLDELNHLLVGGPDYAMLVI